MCTHFQDTVKAYRAIMIRRIEESLKLGLYKEGIRPLKEVDTDTLAQWADKAKDALDAHYSAHSKN